MNQAFPPALPAVVPAALFRAARLPKDDLRELCNPERDERRAWRHLTRFVMPAGWIGQHWVA